MDRIATLRNAALALLALALPFAASTVAQSEIVQVRLEGPIGPATSGYVVKSLEQAEAAGAAAVLLTIDTPGGLDTSMRDIVRAVLASEVPVIGYVAPEGARAASAGTYILLATHVAAMAPATNVGAATPVSLGGGAKPADDGDAQRSPGAQSPVTSEDAMRRKVVNDAVAYIRGLAERRGRNADWAERSVREGASLSADAALKLDVIDLVAPNARALLDDVDGRTVQTLAGEVTLHTAGADIRNLDPDWRDRLLAIVTNPTIAYGLLLIGLYGLLLEGYSPGAIVPGVIGAISLLLGLFALQILPVNYVGLGLMLLGLLLIVAETLVPSFGALGLGGIAAFVIGSIMLMDTDVPGYGINMGLIIGIAVAAALAMAGTIYLLWRARRTPVSTGQSRLIGQRVQITSFAAGEGWAKVGGEHWRVVSDAALVPGQHAVIVAQHGLTLRVVPQ